MQWAIGIDIVLDKVGVILAITRKIGAHTDNL